VADLAIVLHTHMPYVEGFGTYPFGEEWLFDAVARSHLPVLERAERLTMTTTPVLADQLEADGVGERMLDFLRRHRLEPAERDGARSEAAHYRRALAALEANGADPVAPFREAAAEGRVELIPSAATHAVLPLLATRECCRLQLDAGLRSHRRRFGRAHGFWLPECAYAPGLESLLAERGVAYTCVDPGSAAGDPPTPPLALGGGVVGFAIDWPTVAMVWSEHGFPAHWE
jgi:1,4-alpha-glucan branching enzyme